MFDANPLANLRAILKPRYVMRNGQLFESETLDEVWPQAAAQAVVDGLAAAVDEWKTGLRRRA